MFYIIYKITNQINNKIYIGAHITANIYDDYMGSGKYLQNSIKKYGLASFTKTVLHIFDNITEMFAKEFELVDEAFVSRKDTYNLKLGGQGGWDYINRTGKNLYGKNGQPGYGGENLKKAPSKQQLIDQGLWEKRNLQISNVLKTGFRSGRITPVFLGKSHTIENKRKVGNASKKHQKGEGNSQFGTCWVRHPIEGNKKIKNKDLDFYLNQGYIKGRKLKS